MLQISVAKLSPGEALAHPSSYPIPLLAVFLLPDYSGLRLFLHIQEGTGKSQGQGNVGLAGGSPLLSSYAVKLP